MHEFGLCEGIVDAAVRRAGKRPVDGIHVRVGVRHAVLPEAFAQAFALAAQGTVVADAEVTIVPVPMDLACNSCGGQATTDDRFARCPVCGAAEVVLDGGDDLVLTRLTYRST